MSVVKRILVIEDNCDIAEIVSTTAECMEMICTIAYSRAAITAALEDRPAMIVMDMKMPEITGMEVIALLGELACRARIVLMSGVGRAGMEATAKAAGALGLDVVGLLPKPFRVTELMEMLGR
jgi:CheY-like chemotaxis protein